AGKASAMVMRSKRLDFQIARWRRRHLRNDPPLVLRQCADEPFIGLGGTHERIEEYLSVTFRKPECLMLRNGPACSVGKHCHAKVGHFSALQMGCAFNQVLRLFIQTETESFHAHGLW